MSTALVRLCDTPKAVMQQWCEVHSWTDALFWRPAFAVKGKQITVPILFSDGKHDDSDALDALYAGQWYYDVKRDTLSRWTSERVFINGPHLISRPLTREQRRRTYTDNPAPFVMNAYPERIE